MVPWSSCTDNGCIQSKQVGAISRNRTIRETSERIPTSIGIHKRRNRLPPIQKRETPFWKFIHKPEDALTFKDVADNLKNYALVGGLYVIAYKMSGHHEFKLIVAGYILYIISFALGCVSFLQSLVFALKGIDQFWVMSVFNQFLMGRKARFRLWLILLVPLTLSYLSITIAMWFAANGAG